MEACPNLPQLFCRLFSRRALNGLFYKIAYLGLRGMGFDNSGDPRISGELYLLERFLKGKIHTAVDIGANEGAYAQAVLKANSEARVFCFEPHHRTFQRLEANIQGMNIRAFNLAVGATDGEILLYDYEDGEGSQHASVHKEVIEQIHASRSTSHTVAMVALDQMESEFEGRKIDLIKIDTEGHELDVIGGALGTIHSHRVPFIQFEFNEMHIVSRTFLDDIIRILPEYDLFRLIQDGLIPLQEARPYLRNLFLYQNIIALRRQ